MRRILFYCFCIIFLSACNDFNEPLIEGEMGKLTIECKRGKTIKIDGQKTMNKIMEEINGSRREGTQEMEFDFEHRATFEDSDGKIISFNLFSNGKAVMSGYYIHSNIDDFCGE